MTDEKREIEELKIKADNFYEKGEYEKELDCYNQIIDIEPNNLDISYHKGLALFNLKKYRETIDTLSILEINRKKIRFNLIIAFSYLELKNWIEAGKFFGKGNIDIIEAISWLHNQDEKKHIEEIAQNLLKHQSENYFWKVLKRTGVCKNSEHPCEEYIDSCQDCTLTKECDLYRKIYLEALQIITKLQVNHTIEEKVAHYTTKDSTRLLLLTKDENEEPSKFRLASTARANDPKEGQTLFDYLYGDKQSEKSSNYRAFIGCFTFNHQSLNQFRLYGKEKGRDASGVSIVVNKDFFNSKIELTQNMRIADQDIDNKQQDENKLALFRCIYIDPETKAVISLGHKELYAHIREEKAKEINESIEYYDKEYQKEYIEPALQEVRERLNNLKELIKDSDVKPETVNELLLMLSHLVKHVAYKEEQECRILDIASLSGDDRDKSATSDREVKMEIDRDAYRMFMEYDSMADYVDRLYMGNQFEDFELFRDIIKIRYNKECDLCNHPYASS